MSPHGGKHVVKLSDGKAVINFRLEGFSENLSAVLTEGQTFTSLWMKLKPQGFFSLRECLVVHHAYDLVLGMVAIE